MLRIWKERHVYDAAFIRELEGEIGMQTGMAGGGQYRCRQLSSAEPRKMMVAEPSKKMVTEHSKPVPPKEPALEFKVNDPLHTFPASSPLLQL